MQIPILNIKFKQYPSLQNHCEINALDSRVDLKICSSINLGSSISSYKGDGKTSHIAI